MMTKRLPNPYPPEDLRHVFFCYASEIHGNGAKASAIYAERALDRRDDPKLPPYTALREEESE